MTNEEKARDIGDDYYENALSYTAEDAAMKMAQWKDEQLSKAIDELKEEYLELWTNNLNTTEDTASKLTALNRLKQILLETNL